MGVTASQVKPAGFVEAVAKNGSAAPSVAVTATVWMVAAAPARAITVIAGWLTLSSAVLLTLKVTGITSGAAVEPGTVSVILPLQTCGVMPCGFTDTTT